MLFCLYLSVDGGFFRVGASSDSSVDNTVQYMMYACDGAPGGTSSDERGSPALDANPLPNGIEAAMCTMYKNSMDESSPRTPLSPNGALCPHLPSHFGATPPQKAQVRPLSDDSRYISGSEPPSDETLLPREDLLMMPLLRGAVTSPVGRPGGRSLEPGHPAVHKRPGCSRYLVQRL